MAMRDLGEKLMTANTDVSLCVCGMSWFQGHPYAQHVQAESPQQFTFCTVAVVYGGVCVGACMWLYWVR